MATRTTYTSTELSPDRNAAFEAGVTRARARIGSHDLLVGGEHRPGRGGTIVERNPADQREELEAFAAALRRTSQTPRRRPARRSLRGRVRRSRSESRSC
jgi:hypothetical protein